jgi:hypothetical protein
VGGRFQARLGDFNEATLLWQRYLQGISRPCHVSATCSFFPTVSTECTMYILYTVQWGVLRLGLRAKVPDIADSGYLTVKKPLVGLGTGKSLSFFYSAVQSAKPVAY